MWQLWLLSLLADAAAQNCSSDATVLLQARNLQVPPAPPGSSGAVPPPPPSLYNNILIRSDLWRTDKKILSAGLGFDNYNGLPNTTNLAALRAMGVQANDPSLFHCNATLFPGGAPMTNAIAQMSGNAWNAVGYGSGCDVDRGDGLPVCFSWPMIGVPDPQDFEFTISSIKDGSYLWTMRPTCAGFPPNFEFNERHCVVLFADFGSRNTVDGYFPSVLTIVNNSGGSWQMVGPNGPESPVGLTLTTEGHAYQDCKGPFYVSAKLNKFSADGESCGTYAMAGTSLANSGLHLYGDAAQYRIRMYYTGGMKPNGINGLNPDSFERLWSVNLQDGQTVKQVGKSYATAKGNIRVVGLADLGDAMPTCQDYSSPCYAEDSDNYLDIIFEADSDEVAALVKSVSTKSGLFNPGGPGVNPVGDYTKANSPSTIQVMNDLEGKMQVTYCNGQFFGSDPSDDDIAACNQAGGVTVASGPTYPDPAKYCKPVETIVWEKQKNYLSNDCPEKCYDYDTETNADC